MKVENSRRSIDVFLRTTVFLTIAISVLVMTAWLTGWSRGQSIFLHGATMKFNTALMFFFTAIALHLSLRKTPATKLLVKILTYSMLLVPVITLFEYIVLPSFSIDQIFIEDTQSKDFPGRMSQGSAISFIIIGLSLLGLEQKKEGLKVVFQYFLMMVGVMSLIVIITFLFGINSDFDFLFIDTVAFHTAVLFFILSISFSLKNPNLGFVGLFFVNNSGTKVIRIVLPIILFVPILISYFITRAFNSGEISASMALGSLIMLFIIFSGVFFIITAVLLNRSARQKDDLGNDLYAVNKELIDTKRALDETSIVAITNPKGIMTYINDKFCEISKYSREELIGKQHNIINSGYHSKQFFADLWKTIAKGNIWVGEIKNKAKDGSYYWVHTSIVPFKNESGKIYQYLSLRQDITAKKLAEELLNSQYVKKLKQKNIELEQFAFIASHDLQEPLRSITGLINLLNHDYGDKFDGNGQKYLEFITQGASRMSSLIKDLLSYSRLGKENLLATIDCNEILEQVKVDLSVNLIESGSTLICDNLPVIKGFEISVRQLFQNLITNAIKFRNEGVTPQITIGFEEITDYWKFSVSDNGIGIEEENKTKIFNIFQRLHSKDQYEGSGIGLANCKKIVELHGGEIWVESEYGNGSTFYFTLLKDPIIIPE